MGVDVHLLVCGPGALLEVGRRRIDGLERRWSRFIDTSEISRLNAAEGQPCVVSRDTVTLILRGIDGWRVTDGRFDPTVLGDIIRNGYDRTFDEMDVRGCVFRGTSDMRRGCDRIEVDPVTSVVRLPLGVGFDPGGIGKGLAADIVADELMAAGADGVLVNIGGDLRVAGAPPEDDEAWVVAIEHPDTGLPVAILSLSEGAVATSSPVKRQWNVAGAPHHHLLVPATGQPAASDVISVSAITSLGWQAEVLAKAAYLAGVTAGLALLERSGADGLLVDIDGGRHGTTGLARFEHPSLTSPSPSR
jgi:thiamine biosynthesis lipoprotein